MKIDTIKTGSKGHITDEMKTISENEELKLIKY